MIRSIWSDTVCLPSFPTLKRDLTTDVLVIGGGMAGILCAYKLTQAGVDCTLVDAQRLCSGITQNTTAKITSQHGLIYSRILREFGREQAQLYWQANQNALQQYRILSRKIPCDFETQDSFIYDRRDRTKIDRELEALTQLGIPCLDRASLPLPFSTVGAVGFTGQAQFHPLKFISGLLEGLTIYENTCVRDLDGLTAVTDHARIRASHIIVATHFPFLNRHGSYFVKLYQQRSYVLALKTAGKLSGMYADADEKGLSFRSCGNYLLLGSGSHRTGKPSSGWNDIRRFAQRNYPGAPEAYRWAAQDCITLDAIPYIGRYSKNTPNLYVATGFNKWGMTSSMAAADVLCDLVQGKENPYTELFSPSRTMLRPQLFQNALESTLYLLTPTVPRCPHMGCALKWNPREHSWDCPCHGSRFSQQGDILDNPANNKLDPPPRR